MLRIMPEEPSLISDDNFYTYKGNISTISNWGGHPTAFYTNSIGYRDLNNREIEKIE